MATKDSSKSLAVYVIGMSGSMDYVGCGKSSLCQQFVYEDYTKESCSTLLQSEFDSDVINRRHSIYWGQKKKTYMNDSSDSITVNFDIFEHTIFYEDGTNLPYPGHQNYEKRVLAPLKTYANAYAFKSRDEVLSPEAYGNKRFSYSKDIPVAYLYVMDVSEPFYPFNEQLHLMNKLVKSIQKKHCCVVVASKFDIHTIGSVERLEIHANNLKVPVVHCSAKFNTNIQTAFKSLAVKALSLKRIVDDKLRPKKTTPRRPLSSIFSRKASPKMDVNDHLSNGIQSSHIPAIPPRTGSRTLPNNYRNSFENPSADELSKRNLSVGNTTPGHSNTLPVTYYQNVFDFKSKPKHTNLSTPKSAPSSPFQMSEETDSDFKPAVPRRDMPLSPLPGASGDDCTLLSIQPSSDKLDTTSMPSPPIITLDAVTSNDSKEGNIQQSTKNLLDAVTSTDSGQGSTQQSSEKPDRSSPTPLDAVTSNDSKEGSVEPSSEKLDRSSMPLPPTPLDAVTTDSDFKPAVPRCDMPLSPLPGASGDDCTLLSIQPSSSKLDTTSMPSPPIITLDAVTSTNSGQESTQQSSEKPDRSSPTPLDAITSNDSKEGSVEPSSEKLDRSSMPLPPTPLDAVIIQQNSDKLDRSSMPLPPTPLDAVTSTNSGQGGIQQSSEKLDRSLMPLPPTPLDAVIIQQNSDKLDRSSMPLPPTPLDAVSTGNLKNDLPTSPSAPVEVEANTLANKDKNISNGTTDDAHVEEYSSSSDGYERIDFLDFPEKQWSPFPSTTNDTAATDVAPITTTDGGSRSTTDTEINSNKQADMDQITASATSTSTNDLPSSTLEVIPASATKLLPTADTDAAKDHETTDCLDKDYVISDYEFYSMKKQRPTTYSNADVPVYLELKCLNPDLGNYILMHKVDSPNSTRALQTYAYDYVYHSYIKMCRRKLRQSGVPPRRVKREGYTPSVSVDSNVIEYVSYVNVTRSHDTNLLPPRSNDVNISSAFPEEQSDLHPVMPPRNISRNGCYLSAPSAIPM